MHIVEQSSCAESNNNQVPLTDLRHVHNVPRPLFVSCHIHVLPGISHFLKRSA